MTTSTKAGTNTTGSSSWTNPNNALVSDSSYAVSSSTSQNSNTAGNLYIGGMGFTIPTTATIDSIQVSVTGKNAVIGTGFAANSCALRVNSVAVSGTTAQGSVNFTATTDQTRNIPNTASLWGASSISPSDVNDSTFQIRLAFRNINTTSQTFSVNYVTVTVVYTEASGVQSSQQFFSRRF